MLLSLVIETELLTVNQMSKKKASKSNKAVENFIPGSSLAVDKKSHVFLIDGSGYIFRAYHALPPLTRPSDGTPVGAVHGFCQMLWKLLQDSKEAEKPTHVAVIFDAARENFRNEIYPEYKAHRPPAPEDLIPQFSLIRQAVKAFNVACIEQEGFEADDLIATYAREAVNAGGDVTIISSDKDLMQLVRPGVLMHDTMKSRRIGEAEVLEKFGVKPDKVIDVQSLAGDSTDNIPGVPGIGVKTAALLIEEYGDLDTLLDRAEEIKQKKRRENLVEFADLARISRELVTLDQNVPVEYSIDKLGVEAPEANTLLTFMREMEFNTMTRRIAEALGVEAPEPLEKLVGSSVKKSAKKKSGKESGNGKATPADLAALRHSQILSTPIDTEKYEIASTSEQLQVWIDEALERGFFAFDTETTSLDAMQAELVGFSMATEPGRACYVPLTHRAADGLDLEGVKQVDQIPPEKALKQIKPLLEDPSILKIGQNLKYDGLLLKQYKVDVQPIDDTMLMSYALDAGKGGHGMDDLASRHLDHTCIKFKDIAGSGKSQLTFDQIPIDEAAKYAAEDADVTLRLWTILKPRLAAEKMTTVYETLERPLVAILVDMENAGITVDRSILSRLSGSFAQTMAGLEAEIHELAGEKFNVASPKQLGEILFDKLSIEGGKKTKTGAWGTGADVLEDLAAKGHDLPQRVLDWRGLAKLKSTYTDALPTFIHPSTGRIHTSYAMAATTTGRLASTDPNLQNIPVRTAEGRQIRTAFVSEKGKKLISADYSQIELRVLAHIANIESLKQAFEDGLDIHAMTASEMFSVPLKDMDPSVRRRAKAINFGIIYGISAFGLANQLGISRTEAGDYIKTYFKRFPGIRDYMEATKSEAHAQGFVSTIFGRKIHYPEINTKNPQRRSFFERAAINAPIQGSAADIIRRAMVRIPDELRKKKLKATMLLQVHDELIFEVPDKQIDKTIKVVSGVMENAPHPAVEFSIPLKVDARSADNWDEAH